MNGYYPFQIGNYTAIALRDGARSTTLEQTYPQVPPGELKTAAEALGVDPDDVSVGYNVLYVNVNGVRLLVDTGSGRGELVENLVEAGVEPGQIDRVILTHGDGDHVGGIDSFPNARFIMTPHAWSLWTEPESREEMVQEFITLFPAAPADEQRRYAAQRAAYGAEVLPNLEDRVDLVEPEREFLPGVRLVAAPGHRMDHTAVEFVGGDEALLHVVDALRHPLQIEHPAWTSFIDSDPAQVRATNRRLFQRAAQKNALLFGAHLPFPGLLAMTLENGDLAWTRVS
jgi:glyoxylase-like metal-dependent hydrolase (beta-lactamase superfamily II)